MGRDEYLSRLSDPIEHTYLGTHGSIPINEQPKIVSVGKVK